MDAQVHSPLGRDAATDESNVGYVPPARPLERYLRTLRALAECYHAFERCSNAQIREFGLTPAQFDVIGTLGNTNGMTFKELGTQCLITKCTLTGVIDRMEAQGWVKRVSSETDKRSTLVLLTREGDKLFQKWFPVHIQYLKQPFSALSKAEFAQLEALLGRLTAQFETLSQRRESSESAASSLG
jgi:MarR family transcriptional regulator, 2-MHQ and catechol-resistance regulon repressor